MSPARDLLQATNLIAKMPLTRGEFYNEGPPVTNNAAGIDRDLLCPPHTTAEAPNDYVPKWVGQDLIPEYKATRLSGYNHFLAQVKGPNGLMNLESQTKTELPGSGTSSMPMRRPLVEPLLESIDLPPPRSNVTRPRDAAWTFSLPQAMNTILPFDGNPDSVAFFCRVVRNVLNEFGPSAECWLMSALASKFRGRAAEGYMCRMNRFTSVEKVRDDITMTYTHAGGADRLLAELKVIKQETGEGVGSYGQRVEILLNRLLNTYDADRSLQDFERLTYKNRADSEALEQFLYELQGDLQHQVRAANPKTLVEVITEAVRVEQRTGARRVGTQTGPTSAEGILTELMEKYAKLKDDNQLEATVRKAPAKARCGVCGMDNHPEDRCQYKDAETKFCIFCKPIWRLLCSTKSLEERRRHLRERRETSRSPIATTATTSRIYLVSNGSGSTIDLPGNRVSRANLKH